jgi:hypothetical protein
LREIARDCERLRKIEEDSGREERGERREERRPAGEFNSGRMCAIYYKYVRKITRE